MMTPKEYAERLIIKFDLIVHTELDQDFQVLQCAKAATQEILNVIEFTSNNDNDNYYYFQEVLNELNN